MKANTDSEGVSKQRRHIGISLKITRFLVYVNDSEAQNHVLDNEFQEDVGSRMLYTGGRRWKLIEGEGKEQSKA